MLVGSWILGIPSKLLDPTGVPQFDESAGGCSEPVQIRRGEFETFLFPFRRDAKPIDPAAFDHEHGFELPRGQEQPMKGRVAQIIGFRRLFGPSAPEGNKKAFVGIADPNTGFRREPIEASQPSDGQIQARIL